MEQARKTLERLVQIHPRSAEGWWLKGQLELLNFDAEKGARFFRQALALDPEDANVHISLGQAMLMLQRTKQAKTSLNKAIQLDAELPMAHLALGWAHLFEEDLDAARGAFNRVLRLDNQQAEAHAGMAYVDIGENKLAEAERDINRALQLDQGCIAALAAKSALAQMTKDISTAQRSAKELYETATFGPYGWTLKEAQDKVLKSPTGKYLTDKFTRALLEKSTQKPTKH